MIQRPSSSRDAKDPNVLIQQSKPKSNVPIYNEPKMLLNPVKVIEPRKRILERPASGVNIHNNFLKAVKSPIEHNSHHIRVMPSNSKILNINSRK
jgi:hypothetical protein